MIVYEIENMETHKLIYVQAETRAFMISELKRKGFAEVPGMFLSGYNSKGEEVSAMEATLRNISSLKPLAEQ